MASEAMAETAGKVRLTSGGGEAIAVLDDTPASRDFLSMLPLELTFKDYNGTEKISYLPRKLATQGSPSSCTPEAGAFTYYAPWGNLALFYRGFRHSDGLVPLGKSSPVSIPLPVTVNRSPCALKKRTEAPQALSCREMRNTVFPGFFCPPGKTYQARISKE